MFFKVISVVIAASEAVVPLFEAKEWVQHKPALLEIQKDEHEFFEKLCTSREGSF